jgi:arsenate reductase-like glutaredoxin family protein
MTYITNCSKWEAAKKWAKSHDTEFIILTEKDLKINNSKK